VFVSYWLGRKHKRTCCLLLFINAKNFHGTSDLTDFQNAVACKGYTSVLSKMVQVIFAVLGVSFWALTTVVKLPWKFLALIFAALLPFFFAARCYASAALAVMRCPSVCLPECLSRSYMHSVKTNIHIFIFLPSVSHTILIFPYQTL